MSDARAPASSTSPRAAAQEDFALAKENGLAVIAPLDEDGIYRRRLRLADRPIRRRRRSGRRRSSRELGDDLERKDCSIACSTTRTATRTAGAAAPSSSSAWSTSGSSPWTSCAQQLIGGRRAQVRWIPRVRPEARELDWLRNMHDWMISRSATTAWRCRSTSAPSAARSRSSAPRRAARSARSRAGTSSRATPRTGPASTRSRSPARSAAAVAPNTGRRQPLARRGHRALLDR